MQQCCFVLVTCERKWGVNHGDVEWLIWCFDIIVYLKFSDAILHSDVFRVHPPPLSVKASN